MRKLLALVIALLTFPALAQTALLTWALPTARTDGSALPVSQIGTVLVQQNGATTATLAGAPTTYTTGTLAAGTYEYDVIVCDTSALCSTPSAAASVTIPSNPPSVATDIQLAYFPHGAPTYNTEVFNCSGFAASGGTTGNCGTSLIGSGGQDFAIVGTQGGSTPTFSGTSMNILPTGADHAAISLNYQTLVNIQKFQSTFTFVPNGQNIVFMVQNSNNNSANGQNFSAGAGCEADFFQGFSQPSPPNNIMAIELDSYSPLTGPGSFSYSSVQWYTPGVYASNAPSPPGQSPCNPNLGGTNFTYASVTKISTSPVPLNSPAGTQNTTTGDTYFATVTYDGNNLSISMYDVTAGGACPGATCFSTTWSGVSIPSIVGSSNTAWVGLGGATGLASSYPLYVKSFTYYTP
jgi:hypothetical protein